MRRRALQLSLLLLVLLAPAICRAEWRLMDGKPFESAYGTKCYVDTKMNYGQLSSPQTPQVVFWGRVVLSGKSDPVYAKLVSAGGPPETATLEMKYQMDINKKTAALLYGILYDSQGRVIGTEEVKKPVYTPILPDSGAESVWLMIREMHEKGVIPK